MKKIFLFLGITAAFNASAQFTITSAMAPVPGDVETSVPTLTTGLATPSSGTNQFWNYSSAVINPTASPQSSTYTAVSAAPNANLFPGATIASTSDNVNYSMTKFNSSTWENLGTAAPTLSDCVVYSNPMSYINLPFSYGSTHNDTHAYATSNSTLTGNSTTVADGTGTLAIPGYTFTNVLKAVVSFTQTEFDGTMTTTSTVKMNAFFNASSKFPLMTIMNYTFSIPGFSLTGVDASINGAFVVSGIKDQSAFAAHVSVYPNPASGVLTLKNDHAGACNAQIINAFGELVLESRLTGLTVETLDISALTPGIYFIHLKNEEGGTIKKLIVK